MDEKIFLKKLCDELTAYRTKNGEDIFALHPESIHLIMDLFEHYFALKNIAKRLTDDGIEIIDKIVRKIIDEMEITQLDKKGTE